MKLTFVTHWLSKTGGGVSEAVESLSRVVDRQSAAVQVLGLEDERWALDRLKWRGASACAFAPSAPRILGRSPALRRALQEQNPDVVHTHGIWMYPSADVSAWSRDHKPYLVSPHGMLDPWALGTSAWKKRLARFLFEDRHFKHSRCLHALNTAEAVAIRRFGYQGPIVIIPNGVDTPADRPALTPPWPEAIRLNARVLLFLGRLHRKKNVHGLIDAVSRLRDHRRLDGWHIVVAGSGSPDYTNNLIRKSRDLSLGDVISFIGPVYGPEKEAAYRNASAFILPSQSEGLPIAVLEAWGYGLPVAMTPECNLVDSFALGAAHPLSAEPVQMSMDLAKFLSAGTHQLRRMGSIGRTLVKERYSWETIAQDFSHVYDWVAAGGRPSGQLRWFP